MNEKNEDMEIDIDYNDTEYHYDGWDDDSEDTDSEDDQDISEEKLHKKRMEISRQNKLKKRQWKEGEKQKFKDKECPRIIRSNLRYENQELVDKVDGIAEKILAEQGKNKYRDHFFPLIIDAMGLKCGVEIGVDKAEFSLHILSKSKIEKYYCVDNYMDGFGSNCKPGFYDKDGNKRFLEAQKTLEPFVSRSQILRTTSVEASKKFENNFLDFCYIDGDHSLDMIFDLYSWVPKIKIGGIISGHDYKDGNRSGVSDFFGKQLDYKVKTCVDYYCQRYGYKLNVIGGRILSWFFVKNRDM